MLKRRTFIVFIIGLVFYATLGCALFTTAPISTNTTSTQTTTSSVISTTTTESALTIQLKGIYQLALTAQAFSGTYEEWLQTVKGPQGIPGENGQPVILQVSEGYIQWKYLNATSWTNLIELISLIGPVGLPGTDGQEIQLQVSDGYIQWKYANEDEWTNLISLTTLTGEAGTNGTNGESALFQVSGGYIQWKYPSEVLWKNLIELTTLTGPQGLPGSDGQTVQLQVSGGYIQWKYIQDDQWTNLISLTTLTGEAGTNGTNGESALFQVSGGYIQWKYPSEVLWKNLIELTTLTGPQGLPGSDGQEVMFQVANEYLQWKYIGEIEWRNLLNLTTLKGEDAIAPTISINQNGFWVINGVVTEYSALFPTAPNYTVTFHLNGGSMPQDEPLSVTIQKGDSMILPIPIFSGYLFTGWMTGSTVNDTKFTNYIPVTRNLDLYANWEVDMGLVRDFFNTLQMDRFILSNSINSYITNGSTTIIYDSNKITQISPTEGGFLLYFTETGLTLIPDYINMPKDIQKYQYYLGENKLNDLLMYEIYINKDGNWDTKKSITEYNLGFNFDLFNPDLFVKRAEGLIYDYPVTLAFVSTYFELIFSQFGIDLPFDLAYDTLSCVLNLETNTLTIDMSGMVDIAFLSMSSYVIHIEINLSEVGTAEVILPMDDIKANFIDTYNQSVSYYQSSWEYTSATLESREAFDILTSESLLSLESLNLPIDLLETYIQIYQDIRDFVFEIDYLRLSKENAEDYIENQVNYAYSNATNESYQLILDLKDDYLLIINLATSEEEILDILSDFEMDYSQIFDLDILKLGLNVNRQNWIEYLNIYVIYLPEYLQNEEDLEELYTIFSYYRNEILIATDQETIEALYYSAYNQFLLSDFVYGDFETLIINLSAAFQDYYMMNYDYAGEDFEALEILYLSLLDSLSYELSPLEILYRYNEIVYEFFAYLFPYYLPGIYTNMDIVVDRYGPFLSTENTLKLDYAYDMTLLLIESAQDINSISAFFSNFYLYAILLPQDPWKIMKVEAIDEVESILTYNTSIATLGSINLMQNIFNNFIVEIDLLTYNDTAALSTLVQETIDLININFIVDPIWVPLVEARAAAIEEFTLFYNAGKDYLINEETTDEMLYDLFMDYIDLIKISFSFDDIDYYLNLGKEALANFPGYFLPIDSIILEMSEKLAVMHSNWINEFGINDYTSLYVIDHFEENAQYSYGNPFCVFLYYEYAENLMYEELLMITSDYFYNILTDIYLYYSEIVSVSKFYDLDDLYYTYNDMLAMNTDFMQFNVLVLAFADECEILMQNEWQAVIDAGLAHLNDILNDLLVFATDDSVDMLLSIFADWSIIIQESTSEEMALRDIAWVEMILYDNFIESELKIALNRKKIELIESITFITNQAILVQDDPIYMDAIVSYRDSVISMIEAMASYDDIEAMEEEVYILSATQLDYPYFELLDTIKEQMVDEIDALIEWGLLTLPDLSADTYLYYDIAIANILDQLDIPHLLVVTAYEISQLKNFIKGDMKQFILDYLEMNYLFFENLVNDRDVSKLNDFYSITHKIISSDFVPDFPLYYVNHFIRCMAFIEIDYLKPERENIMDYLDGLYLTLAYNATEMSISDMLLILEEGYLLIQEVETYDELLMVQADIIANLNFYYVEDPYIVEYRAMQIEYQTRLDLIMDYIYFYTSSNLGIDDALNICSYYKTEINSLDPRIESMIYITIFYEDAIELLKTTTFDWILSLSSIIEELLNEFEYMYLDAIYYLDSNAYLVEDEYLYRQETIELSVDIFDVFVYYLEAVKEFYVYVLDTIIYVTLIEIQADMIEYQSLVDVESLLILEEYYYDAVIGINDSDDWYYPGYYLELFTLNAQTLLVE